MQQIKCLKHGEKFKLPNSDEEFLFGNLHNDLLRCQVHHEQFPECQFVKEVSSE